MNTKLLGRYSQFHLAHIHKGVLIENGIESFLFGENFMNAAPYFTGILNAGIELRVKEEDYDKAMEILAIEQSENLKCPECQSTNLDFSYGKNKISIIMFSILSAILLVLPFGNLQRQYFCKDCGFKMKK